MAELRSPRPLLLDDDRQLHHAELLQLEGERLVLRCAQPLPLDGEHNLMPGPRAGAPLLEMRVRVCAASAQGDGWRIEAQPLRPLAMDLWQLARWLEHDLG